MSPKSSETITENIFRSFYGSETFIEKSAIPKEYGFKSKKGTSYTGYPDFFKDLEDYTIIVEAKAISQKSAETEVQFYMEHNTIHKDLIGIAVSGQHIENLRVTYFYKLLDDKDIQILPVQDKLITLNDLAKSFRRNKYGEMISASSLVTVLKSLNKTFNNQNKIRDTDRSLFFSGLMIALTNNNFRSTYNNIQAPSKEEVEGTTSVILEAHNLNNAILDAISIQLKSKINNLSKEFSWKDKFSFIKNIDYSLIEYKEIINKIETKIFKPFLNEEKQDILGRAYKIFLSRAGKVENKNIILTPDHIKSLMVKLARLTVDDVVLDTCTGSGGFLMESMETMVNLAHNDPEKIRHIKEEQLIGFEIDSVLFALTCSNMFLHGDGRSQLIYRSSLLNDNKANVINSSDEDLLAYIHEMKPTKVIINPPYENNNSIKFTKQALEYLEPNGKLIIIMPTPTLTYNQNGLTEKILAMAKLDFVIKMPNKLFTEQKRTVNTSIFGFTKTPHSYNDDVLFYNLEDDGFVSVQHKGRIDKYGLWPDIEKSLLDAIGNSREIPGVCQKKKIYKNGILNCSGVPLKRDSNYEMVRIQDLFNIEWGTLASNDCEDQGEYDFITASEEWKKHSSYSHHTEAIIYAVSASGSLGRTHYVNGKFIASNLCLILTKNPHSYYKIDMEFYHYYFSAIRHQIIADLADGTSKLTISKPAFADYYIDYIPYEIQQNFIHEYVDQFHKIEEKYNKALQKMENRIHALI